MASALHFGALAGFALAGSLVAAGFRSSVSTGAAWAAAALWILHAAACLFSEKRPPPWTVWSFAVLTVLTAALWFLAHHHPAHATDLGSPDSPETVLSARIQADWGMQGKWHRLVLRPEQGALVLLEMRHHPEELAVGDRVRAEGRWQSVAEMEEGGWKDYLIREDIRRVLRSRHPPERLDRPDWPQSVSWRDPLFWEIAHARMETWVSQKMRRYVEPRAAGFAEALITSRKSEIPADIREDFKATGTFHVLAVSGSHAAALAAVFYGALRCLGMRRRLAMGLLLFLVFPPYLFLTSFQMSIVRTWVMCVALWAIQVAGRQTPAFYIWSAAVLVMIAVDPDCLFQAGFQLSAGAVLGMGLAGHALRSLGWKNPLATWCFMTLGAESITTPVVLAWFGAFSWMSPLANALIAPVVPFSLFAAMFLALCPVDFLCRIFGDAVSLSNHLIFRILHGVRWEGSMTGAAWRGHWGLGALTVLAVVGMWISVAALGGRRRAPPEQPPE